MHDCVKRSSLLGIVAGLLCLGCSGGSTPNDGLQAGASPDAVEGIRVVVDGESRDFSSATLRLCSDGLPSELSLIATTTGESCPEIFSEGPAASPVSRGRLCEELLIRVQEVQPGESKAAAGQSHTQVVYTRHDAPAFTLFTGDSGTGNVAGSVTVSEFRQTPDGDYRIALKVSLSGEADLEVGATASLAPTYCIGA